MLGYSGKDQSDILPDSVENRGQLVFLRRYSWFGIWVVLD